MLGLWLVVDSDSHLARKTTKLVYINSALKVCRRLKCISPNNPSSPRHIKMLGALLLWVKSYLVVAKNKLALPAALECSHCTQVDITVIVICLFKTVSDLVSKVVVEGSELLAEIGEHLNHEVRVRKNWRDLAYKLGISPEDSKTFDTSTETSKSPTRMMFEWLQSSKPKLTVRDLVNGLENIDRYDVVDVVRKDVAIGE